MKKIVLIFLLALFSQLISASNQRDCFLKKSYLPWTQEEDEKFIKFMETVPDHSKIWVRSAAFLKTKNQHQCRHRWTEHIDPKINKKPFTDEEDRKIFQLYFLEKMSFAAISKEMNDRTYRMIKKRTSSKFFKEKYKNNIETKAKAKAKAKRCTQEEDENQTNRKKTRKNSLEITRSKGDATPTVKDLIEAFNQKHIGRNYFIENKKNNSNQSTHANFTLLHSRRFSNSQHLYEDFPPEVFFDSLNSPFASSPPASPLKANFFQD